MADKPVVRMVLVGRTGAGKSATGNTILGRKEAFKDSMDSSSVTSACQKEEAEFEGKSLAVVDTPGLFDTKKSEEEVKKEIARCISFIAPGPHVFLVVIRPDRFTKEEQETVKIIQTVFGEKSREYTMALFTYGDQLKRNKVPIEKIIGGNKYLHDFIRQCGGGYHVLNNNTEELSQVRELLEKIEMENRSPVRELLDKIKMENRSQVTELLEKIKKMVQRNGEKFYTNEMLEEAERAIQEEMERFQKKNPDVKPEEARRQAEEDNRFIKEFTTTFVPIVGFTAAGATAGGSILSGVMSGSAAGPVGAVVGGAVGLGVGIVTALKAKNVCVIQ